MTIADLKKSETGIITEFASSVIPLKLLEIGCLPGTQVTLLQRAPFSDPLYLNVNNTHIAIRKELAERINICKL